MPDVPWQPEPNQTPPRRELAGGELFLLGLFISAIGVLVRRQGKRR